MADQASQDPLQKVLLAQPKFVRELIAGGVAGGLAKTCVAPLERSKIMLQTQRLPGLGLPGVLSHIWRTEGVVGLFRGNSASVLRIVPYAAIHFSAYEHFRRVLINMTTYDGWDYKDMPEYQGKVSPLLDLFAGSSAGATAVLLTYPLDLYTTMGVGAAAYTPQSWQAKGSVCSCGNAVGAGRRVHAAAGAGNLAPHHPGIRELLLRIARDEGLVGLYRGVTPTLMGILPYAGLKFYVYQSLKGWYKGLATANTQQASQPTQHPHAAPAGSQATSGTIVSTSPAEAPASHHTNTTHSQSQQRDSTQQSLAQHSQGGEKAPQPQPQQPQQHRHASRAEATDRVLLAGTAAAARDAHNGDGEDAAAAATAAAVPAKLPVLVMLCFGGVSGLVAQTVTYPLDVIRRRMQVQTEAVTGRYAPHATTWSTTREILAQEGIKGLVRGLSINYLKVVPSTAIGFMVYDTLKEYLDVRNNI